MAIDLNKVTVQQMSGGLSNPAPAFYNIYYDGDATDWIPAADVTLFCAAKGIFIGDGCIIRFKTTTAAQKKDNLGLFIASGASDIQLQVASVAVIPA